MFLKKEKKQKQKNKKKKNKQYLKMWKIHQKALTVHITATKSIMSFLGITTSMHETVFCFYASILMWWQLDVALISQLVCACKGYIITVLIVMNGWFKFNNLVLILYMVFEFYTSVGEELKLKVRKFWSLTLTLVEATGDKTGGVTFCPHPSLIGLKKLIVIWYSFYRVNILSYRQGKHSFCEIVWIIFW